MSLGGGDAVQYPSIRPSFMGSLYRVAMRRLVPLAAVLVVLVAAAAFVGLNVLSPRTGPSKKQVAAFEAAIVKREGRRAARDIDAAVTQLDLSSGHGHGGSQIDSCYADKEQQGFAASR